MRGWPRSQTNLRQRPPCREDHECGGEEGIAEGHAQAGHNRSRTTIEGQQRARQGLAVGVSEDRHVGRSSDADASDVTSLGGTGAVAQGMTHSTEPVGGILGDLAVDALARR